LRQFSETYNPVTYTAKKTKEGRHRLSVSHDLFLTLQATADQEGRPMSQVMVDALAAYLKQKAE
jgi:sulfite reductase (ferredoxin)